jgi:hypothetical protein
MRSNFGLLSLAIFAATCLSCCTYPDQELTKEEVASLQTGAGQWSGSAAAQPFGADESPLVTIRSKDASVDYERPLSQAIQAALERKPSATFLVQGAIPASGSVTERSVNTDASRRGVEKVFRSLEKMGLPADKISLAMTTLPMLDDAEIRVYVR